MKNRSNFRIFTTILSVFVCFGVLPQMQATLPPQLPNDSIDADGCYPAFNTAEGCSALRFVDAGIGDTGVGWFALFLVGDGSFNTGLGAGALAINSPVAGVGANDNTAVGTAAMFLNLNGTDNVAVGTNALRGDAVFGQTGDRNVAIGSFAMFENDDGDRNNAIGSFALSDNIGADFNNAHGAFALTDNTF